MQLSEKLANRLEKLKSNQQWEEIMTKLLEEFEKNERKNREELEKEKPPIKEKASRHIPAEIKTYILKRNNGQCEFPHCHKHYENLHHTNRFGSNRVHDPDQIVALCKSHHDLAHHGLISNENKLPETWQIRKNPDLTNFNRYIDQQLEFYRRK